MSGMQAGVMLANVYASTVQSQLQAAEEKKSKGKKKRLVDDGKAKFFSGDDFFALCVEDERVREEEGVAAEQRKSQRQSHAIALAAWKKDCDAIRERNKAKKLAYDKANTEWEVERTAAKLEKRRPGWLQPKWKQDFQPETLTERPKKSTEDDEDESNGEDNGEISDDQED